jgi:hypothetical protein
VTASSIAYRTGTGGTNELILQAVLADRTDRLTELAGPASELLRAVLAVP